MGIISHWLKSVAGNREVTAAPPNLVRALSETELDQVAAAGGRTCNSSNPVEDRMGR